MARTAARTVAISDDGGTVVRRTMPTSELRSVNGRKISGSAVGFCGRPRYFSSPTTPTIDIHGLFEVSEPNFTRLPIGSCPGQKRLTTPSLTITAGAVGEISASLNVRP